MKAEWLKRLSFVVAVALVLAVLFVSCSVPPLDLSAKKCSSASDCSSGETCTSAGACVSPADATVEAGPQGDASGRDSRSDDAAPLDALAPADPCTTILYFSGPQHVDGYNDDFASVPTELYPWGLLPPSNDFVPPSGIVDLDVKLQVGWSGAGLHFFFHVHYERDGSVVVPEAGDLLWFGDGVELFLKADSNLTGPFGGTTDVGALHLAASPDQPNPPRTQAYVSDAAVTTDPVASSNVAAHQNPDGYDLEFFIPWANIQAGGAIPEAGSSIGLDFGIDYRNREAGSDPNQQPDYQLLLQQGAVSPTSCPYNQSLPWCDDRTWCRPTLVQ
jgi:hypothetical protein